ncbi:antibiotic biosynthesis monooxygenase [Flavobacterium aquidurense]|uniref:antibiotic biosynthesis monooxygenase n=1 Tax=Flavobacterium aquidurense TaxID=362413 RepID=UPI002856265A|nr:antibiotic biosynthesis monooxygenase [Flavobacterium aquidurense]MDR7370271.1 putative intracellular protease/amidase/quinol monooxygenase YgiN [Flavobacterium aquidurense]
MKTTTYRLKIKKALIITISMFMIITGNSKAINSDNMKKKILFVVTNQDKKGNTGEPTGFYLSEVTHPWDVLVNAGYEIDFVSPKGGQAPIDGFNLGDPTNKKFWDNTKYRQKIESTMKPGDVKTENYAAIHYAGGHGAMWDFPNNKELALIASKIYENNGIVSAVCHGPAGLINIKLSNREYLVNGKKVNAFTNEEEAAVKLDKVVPFLLESKLIERGGIFEKSGLWQTHVVTDQRLVTGQNPQSAKAVGEAVLQQLNSIEMVAKITRYEVKEEYLEQFKKTLSDYVFYALASKENIMAEAFYEQNKTNVLWLIERWNNKNQLENFNKELQGKIVTSLSNKALKNSIKTYYVKDLEPLTKEQWRTAAKKEDNQLIVMLFVDAKKGTQQNFKDRYHIAMPQFRSEPGVVTYQLSEIEGDDTLFVTYEKFRSNDAFQYHLNFPPIKPVLDYLQTSIKNPPFQNGLHNLIEFAPMTRE